ncbi:MAG TPA: ABC transporter ATP-binding protein [Chromatiaceae bacterium]|nr:ABC transporter ATP-binding protein [Chromatiaceae bacterium]
MMCATSHRDYYHHSMNNPLLKASNLGRTDQGNTRLRDFSLSLQRGEVVGLLGVNGAGKSTAMALLSGALAPTSGHVEVLGLNLHQHPRSKKHIGLLPESAPLYASLTVDENLDFAARLRGMASAEAARAGTAIKKRLDLQPLGKRLCSKLSKGMAQRVAIAQALIHSPVILILDEPTAGLDPAQAQTLRDLIRELGSECGILLASHILADMEQLCRRVIILNNGRQVAEQALDESNLVRVQLSAPPENTGDLTEITTVKAVYPQDNGWYQLEMNGPADEFIRQALTRGWQLQALIPAQYNLQSLLTDAIASEPGEQP